MIEEIDGFKVFIDSLHVADSTKKTYRNWIRRIDENLPVPLTEKTVQSEEDVLQLASMMPSHLFTPGHIKDVRCLIRYYLKFNVSKGIEHQQKVAESTREFNPQTVPEGRTRVLRSIALRRGQQKFRMNLLGAYNRACCISGTEADDVLEAAHILPYSKDGTNTLSNGLLLRSDIHVLFDLHLISIHPRSRKVFCAKPIRSAFPYSQLHGRKANFPSIREQWPNHAALLRHHEATAG